MRVKKDIVYIIDPDESVHDALTTLLDAADTVVLCYRDAETFLDATVVHSAMCGCLLMEANLPGMGSLALLRRLRDQGVDLPVVVLTSTSNRDIASQVLKAGAVEVIEKPLLCDRFLKRLHYLAHRDDDASAEPGAAGK